LDRDRTAWAGWGERRRAETATRDGGPPDMARSAVRGSFRAQLVREAQARRGEAI